MSLRAGMFADRIYVAGGTGQCFTENKRFDEHQFTFFDLCKKSLLAVYECFHITLGSSLAELSKLKLNLENYDPVHRYFSNKLVH